MSSQRLVQGNEACAHGALYAGCSFFAGYPITPSSEIMEILAQEMPARGRTFIQLEDEIASISAIIGAVWGGAKVLTATSGPGFSLMQEGLGYASITETPCVIVNCQRWGPSTGQPTKAAQGDVFQSIWGTHGDHAVIVLTASHVRDVFEMTVRAFNFAEQYRVPVVLLIDEVLAHMRENIYWPAPGEIEVVERRCPSNIKSFKPFVGNATAASPSEFLPFGAGRRFHVTGLAHGADGFAVHGDAAGTELQRMVSKVQKDVRKLSVAEEYKLDDAQVAIVSYGITSRPAKAAADQLRTAGIRCGVLDMKTLWPFPDYRIAALADRVERILVPELNLGQIVREVDRAAHGCCEVKHYGRIDGNLMTPEQIATAMTVGLEVAQ